MRTRILHAALETFLAVGIRKARLDAIAEKAGSTRMTVYRYFGDKKGLVGGVLDIVVAPFEQAAAEASKKGPPDIEGLFSAIGAAMSSLPRGNILPLFSETAGLYPDIYRDISRRRSAAISSLFASFSGPRFRGLFRPDIDPRFVVAFLGESVMSLTSVRTYSELGLSQNELFASFVKLFLHGILKSEAGDRTIEGGQS